MEGQYTTVIEENLRVENQCKSGADWFFWIAGLSLINSIILLTGGQWNFIVGLGITQIIDLIGLEIAQEAGIIGSIFAFVFDSLIAGVFIFFGIFARDRHSWAFITGMILYALDGLLFFLMQDMLSIGFHVFALFCIYRGFKASKLLNNISYIKTSNQVIQPT